jgi:PadR family transcriptional regulator, regulatory protein PadR
MPLCLWPSYKGSGQHATFDYTAARVTGPGDISPAPRGRVEKLQQMRQPLADICRIRVMRMTASLERVFRAFLDDPSAPRYGYDLMKAAALPSGTLYPMLARLEAQKLVVSAWETPQQDGERPRRYYRLTGEGIRVARLELAQLSARRRRAPSRSVQPVPGEAQ